MNVDLQEACEQLERDTRGHEPWIEIDPLNPDREAYVAFANILKRTFCHVITDNEGRKYQVTRVELKEV